MERRAIIIVGPTASGKSNVAINLALQLDTEILSADSRQFYKHLNIGTAKITASQQSKVKHHFIDSLNPDDYYNVSKYEIEATKVVEKLHCMNKIPIITGGSGLYIRALVDGVIEDAEIDHDYRQELHILKENKGNEALYSLLVRLDPIAAETMLPQNWKRVIRALEVFNSTGKSIVNHHKEQKSKNQIEFLHFGINWSRELLYDRINKRVELMIDEGLIDEVKQILKLGFDKNLNSLNTVGYKEIISFMDDKISLERAIELIKRNSRRYAKRQLTWFKKDERIQWFDIDDEDNLNDIPQKIINKLNNNS
jgi:tRNA dimethylallyltransferase